MSQDTRIYFGIVDYVIFGSVLVFSSIIGIYHAIKHRNNMSSAEYLVANNSLPWFAIFISMVASFFSAVGVLGIPAQVYATGITFGLHIFSFLIPISLCAEIIAPLFRKLRLISVNEYLELRFSRGVRYMGCFFFHVQYLLYLSIVLFTPSLALYSVAKVPLSITIISTGIVCSIYTSLGGMRAVIWTDVFQSFIMVSGLIAMTVIGVIEMGSLKKVFDIAYKMDRLNISFSPDPKVYHSFWGVTIGLTFPIFAVWTISQPTIQRVIAAKSDREAKRALYASYAAVAFILALLSLVALVIFAFYSDCDPLCSKRISQNDQILPYFIINELGYITGLPGLFTACVYSFALSTISSGLNGMSALFLEDVAKKIAPDISDVWAMRISRLTACIGGIFITVFAFIVPKLGKYVIKLAIQLFSIIGGPYFSIFVLGIFTEKANAMGAYVGGLTGFAVGLALSIGQIFYPPDLHLPPVSVSGCKASNYTATVNPETVCHKPYVQSKQPMAMLFSVSYVWHGLIVVLMSCAIGYVASLCSPTNDSKYLERNLIYDYSDNFIVRKFCYKNHRKYKVQFPEADKMLYGENTTTVQFEKADKMLSGENTKTVQFTEDARMLPTDENTTTV